jgi:hypothetical protein
VAKDDSLILSLDQLRQKTQAGEAWQICMKESFEQQPLAGKMDEFVLNDPNRGNIIINVLFLIFLSLAGDESLGKILTTAI